VTREATAAAVRQVTTVATARLNGGRSLGVAVGVSAMTTAAGMRMDTLAAIPSVPVPVACRVNIVPGLTLGPLGVQDILGMAETVVVGGVGLVVNGGVVGRKSHH
jgi:hypothetical protein